MAAVLAQSRSSSSMAPSATQFQKAPTVTVTDTDSAISAEVSRPELSLFEQLSKSTQEQLEGALLELSDKMSIKVSRRKVGPHDLIPTSMALARMSSLLCVIAQDPTATDITDEMREAHLKDAKRKSDESQIMGDQVSKRPRAKSLAAKMLLKKEESCPYKVECRCAMALWFRVLDQEIHSAFPKARDTEVLSTDLQSAILNQMTTEVEKANLVLEAWMATPEERERKTSTSTSSSSWKTRLPVRSGKMFLKEVIDKTAKRLRVPGKANVV